MRQIEARWDGRCAVRAVYVVTFECPRTGETQVEHMCFECVGTLEPLDQLTRMTSVDPAEEIECDLCEARERTTEA